MNTIYRDPIIGAIIDRIKDNNGEIKRYYQGEPTQIGDSVLPCVIIAKRQTEVGKFTNSQDEHSIDLVLTVVSSIRRELTTEQDSEDIVKGVASLYDIVEGREATYALKSTAILGILRDNISLDIANNLRIQLEGVTRVDYGETLRNRKPEEWSIEAQIHFSCHFIQIR